MPTLLWNVSIKNHPNLFVLVFMKITVNGEEKVSNFPADADPANIFNDLSDDAKKTLEED